MKKRTRILVAAGTLLVVLPIIALVTLPLLFRDRIVARVKSEANQSVNARVNWRDAGLTLFRDFPNLTLRLDDFTVAGTGRFAGDTLAAVRRLQVVLDLGSVLGSVRRGEPIVVRSVELDRPRLALRVLEDGTANWDITKETPGKSGASRPISVSLRRLDIRDADISLDDRKTGLVASLTGYRQALAGDFSQDVFDIQTRAHGDALSVRFAGIPYLNRVALDVTAAVNADMRKKQFSFGRNEIRINDLRLGFSGSATAADDHVALDMAFRAPSTDFRHILSLVPAIYARDFQTIRTTGKIAVQGRIKGDYGERAFPSFAVSAKVSDGTFRYPDLPLPARDIALDLDIRNPGGDVDSTVVRLDRLHAVIGREPIDAAMVLRTPVSDPDLDLRLAGKVDLADVRRTVKLDGVNELAGRIAADIAVRTRMSFIDRKQYDRIAARGTVDMAGLALKAADLPHAVMIDQASLRLSPQRAELLSLAGRIGSSDVRMSGFLDNLVPFVFRGDDLRGSATLASTRFNLDEWRSDDSLKVIPVPAKIDFALQATVAELTLDRLKMTDARGRLRVKDQKVTLESFTMNTLGGEIAASGFYETTDLARPTFDADLRMKNVDIPTAFATLTTVRMLAPVAKYARGSVSTDLRLSGALGKDMLPLFDVLDGKGSLQTSRLVLQDLPAMIKVADALKMEQLRNPTFDAIRSSVQIRDGRVHIDPFDVRLGESTMRVAGSHGIDQSMQYTLHLRVPRSELGAAANRAVASLVSQAGRTGVDLQAAEAVELDVQLGGTVTNPSVKTSLGSVVASAKESVEQAARQEVAERVDLAKERADSAADEARRKAQAEAARLVGEAEQRAAAVREEAKRVAEGVRKEGYAQADALLARATSPIARAAAQPAADRIRKEADAKADRIINEADTRADEIVAEARRKAGVSGDR